MRGYVLAATLAAVAALAQAASPLDPLTRFDRADFVADAGDEPPPAVAPWQRRPLPDDWRATHPDTRQAGWYRMSFYVDGARRGAWLLYAPHLRDGGRVFLNGELLAGVRESDGLARVRWTRPHLFALRTRELRPGANTLLVRVPAPPPGDPGWVGRFTVGPEAMVRPLYERRLFAVSTVPLLMAALSGVMGLFVLSIWASRRMERVYGLFGAGLVCWAVSALFYVVEVVPRELFHLWRAVHTVALGGFVVTMVLFMLRFVGTRWPVYEQAAIGYFVLGALAALAGGPTLQALIDAYWQLGLVPLALVAVYAIAHGTLKLRTVEAAAMMFAAALCVVAGAHDQFVALGWLPLENTPLLAFATLVLLTVMGALLVDRFIRALRAAESANLWLEARVAEKERELAANFARLRAAEDQQVRMEERQRIMQDVHDGIGSQLLTSLGMIERGAIGPSDVAQVLREAIDDLRLVIDMLTPEESDFVAALGNLRYRLEPRFAAAGIRMRWDVRGLPETVNLSPERSLQVLRILQECFANIAKHARATQVQVQARLSPEGGEMLEIAVEDDGVGLDDAARASGQGHGLANMHRRAQGLGATLEFPVCARGTRVALRVPVTP